MKPKIIDYSNYETWPEEYQKAFVDWDNEALTKEQCEDSFQSMDVDKTTKGKQVMNIIKQELAKSRTRRFFELIFNRAWSIIIKWVPYMFSGFIGGEGMNFITNYWPRIRDFFIHLF